MAEPVNGSLRSQVAELHKRVGRVEGIVEMRSSALEREHNEIDSLIRRIDFNTSRLDQLEGSTKLAAWIIGTIASMLTALVAYLHFSAGTP